MKICHISSEISPIAKVGGLADVTLGLSRALVSSKHHSFVILPKYASLKTQYLDHIEPFDQKFTVEFNNKTYSTEVFKASLHGVEIFLIDSTIPTPFFDREKIYGYRDDTLRFAFFSVAALQFLTQYHPDIDTIHIHDWHTALVAPVYKENFVNEFSAKLVFTIHNLAYQGQTSPSILKKVGLDLEKYQELLKDPHKETKINLLKGAISFSDHITTVSPKYAEEILDKKHAKGLHDVISENCNKISGILNGIDTEIWNPNHDEALLVNYNHQNLEKKLTDKDYLRKYLRIPIEDKPLVACICRLVPQKGISLIKKAIDTCKANNAQFILFGSSPIAKIQQEFNQLREQLKDYPDIHFIFDSYNEELSHQIYAGADMLICPSIFEPCGLTQIIALKYGTVPIVRKTGGLANTVFDIEDPIEPIKNGFTFEKATQKEMDKALKRAFKLYREKPHDWKEIIKTGMQMDFSWQGPTQEYIEIYQK